MAASATTEKVEKHQETEQYDNQEVDGEWGRNLHCTF